MTPFERAVEEGSAAAIRQIMGIATHDPACRCDAGLTCDTCLPRAIRAALPAALPHLLAAVVGKMRDGQGPDVVELPTMYLDGRTTGQVYRAALLAALTDAATRLRARAEATPPAGGRDG